MSRYSNWVSKIKTIKFRENRFYNLWNSITIISEYYLKTEVITTEKSVVGAEAITMYTCVLYLNYISTW